MFNNALDLGMLVFEHNNGFLNNTAKLRTVLTYRFSKGEVSDKYFDGILTVGFLLWSNKNTTL